MEVRRSSTLAPQEVGMQARLQGPATQPNKLNNKATATERRLLVRATLNREVTIIRHLRDSMATSLSRVISSRVALSLTTRITMTMR